MPIDGCHRSFDELVRVMPEYMARLREAMNSPISMAEFGVKGIGPVALLGRLGLDRDPLGCYVFIDRGKPIYVGISKHVIARLMEHVRGTDHFSATLAYRIAATHHRHGTTALRAMRDPDFRSRFEEARHYLLTLDAAFVEIADQLDLYVFELYCALGLRTMKTDGGWNTFEPH